MNNVSWIDIWPNLRERIPEGKCGTAEVVHFEMSERDSRYTSIRAIANGRPSEFCSPGKYIQLRVNGSIVMSDTDMEKRSNADIALFGHGSVLIGGLGLGLTAVVLCGKLGRQEEVKDITIIEINPDVIKLVEPYIRHPKLTVIEADIFDWKPERGRKFDTIYFDIWSSICCSNLGEIAQLHQRFKSRLNRENPDSWMDSWQSRELRLMRRNGQC